MNRLNQEPVLYLDNLTKSYFRGELVVPVLHGISLIVERGSLVALMGSSGSGKSTLLNILGCLDTATSGTYLLDGRDVTLLSPEERAEIRNEKVGFCFQSFQLLPRMTALDNVMMPLGYHSGNISRKAGRKRAQDLLARVGLGDRMDHQPSQLSGGQQQRVAIARALVNDPKILFADEPTGALDSSTATDILNLFQQLNREDGRTILLVTHDGNVAASAQRTIRIRDGIIDTRAAA